MDDSERLRLLARHRATFEAPGFSFGAWKPSWTDADGVIHLGWYEFSDEAEAFLADARAGGWVTPFDWGAWLATAEGEALSTDPSAVARADAVDLRHLLTALVRGERFGDGTLASAHERGILTAVVRRAAKLAGDSGA